MIDAFDDIICESVDDSNSTAVFPTVYETIPKHDCEPVTLIEPNINTGPWIAGGAPLRWWQGHLVGESDIDIFCRDAQQVQDVIQRIKSQGRYTQKHASENATTLLYWRKGDYNTQWVLQVINRRYFNSIEEVIGNFDLSVCQIGTCGNEWVLGETTAQDIHNKALRFNDPLHPDAVKRLTKYWIYGYNPVPGTIEAIQNNPESRWKFTVDEDYNNAF
jgi:hypothetical protein